MDEGIASLSTPVEYVRVEFRQDEEGTSFIKIIVVCTNGFTHESETEADARAYTWRFKKGAEG